VELPSLLCYCEFEVPARSRVITGKHSSKKKAVVDEVVLHMYKLDAISQGNREVTHWVDDEAHLDLM